MAHALQRAYEEGHRRAHALMDSKFAIGAAAKILNGAWRGEPTPELRRLTEAIRRFDIVLLQWRPRELNGQADALAKLALGYGPLAGPA